MAFPRNILALDISHWNTIASFDDIARQGVVGVIHKFSEGGSYTDPTYAKRRGVAKNAGLKWGRYHFANSGNIKAQVDNALAGWQPDEIIALDWEDTKDGTMTLAQAEEFVSRVEDETGQVPVLYSGNTAKQAIKIPSAVLSRCRLWLAHYSTQPVCPPGWDKPWLWQWSDAGTVKGVTGAVDLDAYDGEAQALSDTWVGAARLPVDPPMPIDPPVTPDATVLVTVTAGVVKVETVGPVIITRDGQTV